MAIPYEFEYARPGSLDHAVKLLGENGKDARILAGGTDLANQMKQGYRVPKLLIDIKGIPELGMIRMEGSELQIGSLATFNDLRHSKLIREKVNILYEAAGLVGSTGVRNRATLAGNICSAVACMDSASPLLVHEAVIHTMSAGGEKKYPVAAWFIENRKTAIGDDEIVTHISIPVPETKYAGAYQKMMRYSGEDLSQANVGVLVLADKQVRIAFGSVGPIPFRAAELEKFLLSEGVNEKTIEKSKKMIEQIIHPITDVRATKEYRMHMTKVMFEKAIHTAVERLKQPKIID
jgi:CO/xanthine dehydrogenase FAD-binding subunit